MDKEPSQPRRRVVVTGMGIICPIGNSPEACWAALANGTSGTGPITTFDTEGFRSRIAGVVRDFDPHDWLEPKEARRADRYIQFAVASAVNALNKAQLNIADVDPTRVGVIVGTAMGGIATAERELQTLRDRGPGRVSPFYIPMMLADMGSGYVSIVTGAKGPNFATLSACASGAHAIGEATEIIRRGDADVMLAGGSEAPLTPGTLAGFAAAGALSTNNDEAETASRPFDATRDGFVIAEGGAVLVIEELSHAKRRGAPILAEMAGYGATGDACHITQPAPDASGASLAMTRAIVDAGWKPDLVDYLNAHGTSTPLNDRLETLAVKRTFGEKCAPLISSTKALTGHLLGAAGAVEAVFTIDAIQHDIVPPTWHLVTPDEHCDLEYVSAGPREVNIRHALSNSFGFGGHNVSLAFSRFEE